MSRTERATLNLGVLGGVLAFTLFALALATQGSQGLFQINRPAADYTALLIQRAPFLRADLGLDFIFIVVYSAFFVSLALVLKRWVGGQPFQDNVATVVNVATAALLITGVLDVAENAHLLAMLSMAEQGQSIGQSEIAGQMVESQIKFMFSYFGVFVLSFALPQSTIIERLTVFVFRWLQLPAGSQFWFCRWNWCVRCSSFAPYSSSLDCGRRPGSSRIVPIRRRECCVAALQTPCRHRRPGLYSSLAWRRQHADGAA